MFLFIIMNIPVLIGSYALKEYGYKTVPKDIDVMVDTELHKNVWGSLFNEKHNKIDLIMATSGTNREIFEFMNTFREAKKVKIFDLDVLLPPLELLYAIKKSHIHRVIQYSEDSSINTEIWKKHMEMYIWMRNKLGYDRMDEIIYGDKKYGLPLDHTKLRNEEETELEFMVRNIFVKRFDETINKHGDTFNVMDMEKEQFFNDNVPRIIEHDELHKMVAQVCRGVSDEPYRMFQKDTNNAILDRELYFAADKKYRYTLLREEIMVLFLERKIIPELVHCSNKEESYQFSEKKLMKYMDDVISNYCTNLCESGHSWLRQYILDHYDIYSSYYTYDVDKLLDLAFGIVKKDKKNDSKPIGFTENFTDIFHFARENSVYYTYWDEDREYTRSRDLFVDFSSSENPNFIDIGITMNVLDKCKAKTYMSVDDPSIVKKFSEYDGFETEILYLYDDDEELLYSIDNNIGICDSGMFVLQMDIRDKKYLNIDTIFFDSYDVHNLTNPHIDKSEFVKKKSMYCYYSDYDPSCGWQNTITEVYHKLETFGSCDGLIGKLCEILARNILKLEKDDPRYKSEEENELSDLD